MGCHPLPCANRAHNVNGQSIMKTSQAVSTEFSILYAGRRVYVKLSPCSWMYSNYGMQLEFSLQQKAPDVASVFFVFKQHDVEAMPRDQTMKLAKKEARNWIDKMQNRQQLVDAEAKYAKYLMFADKIHAKREAKAMAYIAMMKLKGFTHKTICVIHSNSGDDSVREIFTKGKPGLGLIHKYMKNSAVKNSFKTFEL